MQQALAACNESLSAAARLIREQKDGGNGDLDADLFLVCGGLEVGCLRKGGGGITTVVCVEGLLNPPPTHNSTSPPPNNLRIHTHPTPIL